MNNGGIPMAAKKKTISKNNKTVLIIVALLAIGMLAAGAMLLVGSSKDETTFTATHYVQIEVQDYGTITAELYGNEAPITVANFLKLANEGFYDGLTFHRIISDFMIQGGDPAGNGTGGSDERIKGEFSANGVNNPIPHERGVLSMARSNAYDSASSQFFIMHEEASYLDGQYAAFGKVLSGIEIVDAICANTPVIDGNGTVTAANQPIITSIRQIEKPE
ncbi:MAG: peptidylprolyl isomerase [Clostridia bacterium]|nr:peptidylprolyl isomerase [Clostridia bacterium]